MKKQNWKDDFRPEAPFGDSSPLENKIIIYQTEDGQTQVDVRMEDETVWLTQAQMARLFDKDQSVIARHIANVFKEGELERESNMQILHNTLSKYKPTAIYNLDVIISVGYRVKSQRGVKFRQWANKILTKKGELFTALPNASRWLPPHASGRCDGGDCSASRSAPDGASDNR